MAARREQMSPWEWVLRCESAGSLATYSLLKLPRPDCFYPGPRGLLEPVSWKPRGASQMSLACRRRAADHSPLGRSQVRYCEGLRRIVLFTEAGIPTL